ncbi:MAG: YfiR family protein [Deltaproteobacteria bacterium]
MKLSSLRIALFAVFISASLSLAAEGEYKVKAAMLYNFAKFVEWPAESFINGHQIIYCIAGKSPLYEQMLQMQGKSVKGQTVIVRQIVRPNDVTGCQILFIPHSESNHLSAFLKQSNHHKILTVSELEQFTESGGMVGFNDVENKISFEINQETARKQGLQISSHLLNLARKIR